MSQLLPRLKDMQANSWSMIVFWNETKGSVAPTAPDVRLDFTDQPAPAPDMPPQPPAGEEVVTMIHMAICQWMMRTCRRLRANTQNRISTMTLLKVVILRRSLPEAALRRRYRAANTMTLIWICLWIRTRLAAIHLQEAVHRDRDLDMDHRRLNRRFFMESHDEAPPPRSAWCSWGGEVTNTGTSGGVEVTSHSEPASSSSGPASVPGLPVTAGEFPIQQTPLPEPTPEPPAPDTAEDTDSDATVDYRDREDGLLALAHGDDDVLIRLPSGFEGPSFVPLDGDGFASWLTKQDKVKAGTLMPEMQRKYAAEIRAAKLEEFKSYLDNDAIRLTDRGKLSRDVNFLTGRWVLTVNFSKFKARWVCRGFQDKFAWDQQTDSPTATRYGLRLVAQCAADHY
eukprot:s2546_g9.t1